MGRGLLASSLSSASGLSPSVGESRTREGGERGTRRAPGAAPALRGLRDLAWGGSPSASKFKVD